MRDVTIVISNELDAVSADMDGVTVNSYYARGDDSHRRQGERSLQVALDALDAFASAYRVYLCRVDVVEPAADSAAWKRRGWCVCQMWQLVRRRTMWTMAERAEWEEKLAGTVAHEIAHQWFYAVVGNNQYREAWLDESFAAYSEQVYWRAVGKDESDRAKRKWCAARP